MSRMSCARIESSSGGYPRTRSAISSRVRLRPSRAITSVHMRSTLSKATGAEYGSGRRSDRPRGCFHGGSASGGLRAAAAPGLPRQAGAAELRECTAEYGDGVARPPLLCEEGFGAVHAGDGGVLRGPDGHEHRACGFELHDGILRPAGAEEGTADTKVAPRHLGRPARRALAVTDRRQKLERFVGPPRDGHDLGPPAVERGDTVVVAEGVEDRPRGGRG